MDGIACEADGNFHAGEIAHAAGAGGGMRARLAADDVVIGQRPQLHAVGSSALGQRFRLQGAVRGSGVAVQVSIEFGREGGDGGFGAADVHVGILGGRQGRTGLENHLNEGLKKLFLL